MLRAILPALAPIPVAAVLFFAFAHDLALLTRTAIMMALSLDLVLGFAGIATLGQAAMYGAGAHTAGLFAAHVSGAPTPGLIVGAGAGAAAALLSGLIVLRAQGLTLIMLTIVFAQRRHELANRFRKVTGGADGLRGIRKDEISGSGSSTSSVRPGSSTPARRWRGCGRWRRRPSGWRCRGGHDSPARMAAIGADVFRLRLVAYVLGGAVAGLAGALSAQVAQLVSLEAFSFARSAEVADHADPRRGRAPLGRAPRGRGLHDRAPCRRGERSAQPAVRDRRAGAPGGLRRAGGLVSSPPAPIRAMPVLRKEGEQADA